MFVGIYVVVVEFGLVFWLIHLILCFSMMLLINKEVAVKKKDRKSVV